MKKQTNKKLYTLYYVILVGIVAFKAIQTVYTGSLYVSQKNHLQNLQQETNYLSEQNYDLSVELAQKKSLHTLISSNELEQYTSIGQPITLADHSQVAFR